MKNKTLTPEFLDAIKGQFQLLNRMKTNNRKIDKVELHLSGYEDVMHLVSDIVKVCILALEGETSYLRIPEPTHNICGVLAIVLDLIPYEEAGLLDMIREQMLYPSEVETKEEQDFLIENYYLSPPTTNTDEIVVN
jgi:hypothetical protein